MRETTPPERIWATEDAENFGEDRFHSTKPFEGGVEYVAATRVEQLETTIASAIEEMERPHYGDRDHQLDNFLEAMDTLKRAL